MYMRMVMGMSMDTGMEWVCKATTIDGYEKCPFLWVSYPFSKTKPINQTTMLKMKSFLHSNTFKPNGP